MDPTGPAQPPSSAAYTTTGNPADQSPAELGAAATPQGRNTGPIVDRRHQGDLPVPSSPLGSGTPSALGYGGKGSDDPDVGPPADELDGEQMRAPGEGDVYKQQFHKTGFGEQEDLATDLDRKKAEQQEARERVKQDRAEGKDVGGAVGQSGVMGQI